MYKIIATDLDETLLNDQHQVEEKNRQAIKLAIQKGVKIVPATGRGFMAVQSILKDMGLENKENEYVLSFNGAALTENKQNRILLFEAIDFELVRLVFEFGLQKDVCIRVQTATDIYTYNLNENEKQRFKNQGTPLIELKEPSIDFLKEELISKIVFQNLDMEYLKQLEIEMQHIINGKMSLSYSSNRYLELNKKGIDKGNTLLKLAKLLDVKQEEIIAVGDNYNDIEMLKVAGFAVAAGNAVDEVKNLCNYICKNTNNEGVLAEVIECFILEK